MPRHRIEHEPRHRAPRADRRVPLSAVSSRPPSHAKPSTGPRELGKALEAIGTGAPASSRPASHAKPSTGPGQLGKAFEAIGTGASDRLHTAGSRLRNDQRDLLSGAVRGLIVSPWFAAGAGFVIAAGAFMYAPHASLNFESSPGRSDCPQIGCVISQKAPQMAGGASGLVTAGPSASSSGRRGRHAARDDSDSAPGFTYTVQQDGTGMYQMILTETSEHAIGSWRLSVVIPGATKVSVFDGTQQAPGTDGATASGGDSHGGTNGDAPSPGFSAGALVDSGFDPADSLRVVVDGEGSARTAPDDGVFHDAQGTFRLIRS